MLHCPHQSKNNMLLLIGTELRCLSRMRMKWNWFVKQNNACWFNFDKLLWITKACWQYIFKTILCIILFDKSVYARGGLCDGYWWSSPMMAHSASYIRNSNKFRHWIWKAGRPRRWGLCFLYTESPNMRLDFDLYDLFLFYIQMVSIL